MKKQTNDGVFKIKFENPVTKPRVAKALAGLSIIGITTVGTYFFADNYTLNFRSPVIFQNPVVIDEREVYITPTIETEEFTLEATESAKVETKVSFSPSNRLVSHTEQRPSVYSRIVAKFGDESMKYGELISRESGLNPQAINPSSGACGLAQALPCEKMQCDLEDVDCQLEWISEYVENRYGDIDNTLAFHDRNNWY